MHVAFGRVRRESRIGADSTDAADYRMGDGGRRLDRSKRFICRIGERANESHDYEQDRATP